MAMTANDYQRSGLQLLPQGKAWTQESGSQLAALMLALGDELARVDTVGDQLFDELHPDRSFLLLSDWEQFAGLPDCSIDRDSSIDARRKALATKLTLSNSLCNTFYQQLAASRGYRVTLIEKHPHHCERDCEYPLYPVENWFRVWVYVEATPTHYATTLDNCKQRLRIADTADLECLLTRYAPAEIEFIFVYEELDHVRIR